MNTYKGKVERKKLCVFFFFSLLCPLDYRHILLPSGMRVLCDTLTDGGNWIIIQKRKNNRENFNLEWHSYKNGFGDMDGQDSFWHGLEDIHELCNNNKPCTLRVDMVMGHEKLNPTEWVKYSHFAVNDSSTNYTLSLAGYDSTSSVGDAMLSGSTSDYNNMDNVQFSTHDKDNDNDVKSNCAKSTMGGWWWNHCDNPQVHLNGILALGDQLRHRHQINNTRWIWIDNQGGNMISRYPTRIEMKVRL